MFPTSKSNFQVNCDANNRVPKLIVFRAYVSNLTITNFPSPTQILPKFSDYHWWWRSFIVGGGSGFYVLLYSVFYFFTKLEISSFVPCLLYFGYTCLITITFSCFTGTVSFYSSYIFINKIYGQIKID